MKKDLGLDGLSAVKALAEAREAVKRAEQAVKEASAQIRDLLGEATEGTVAGVSVVKIVTVTRHGVDTKALKDKEPEIYAAFETTTVYDQIRL